MPYALIERYALGRTESPRVAIFDRSGKVRNILPPRIRAGSTTKIMDKSKIIEGLNKGLNLLKQGWVQGRLGNPALDGVCASGAIYYANGADQIIFNTEDREQVAKWRESNAIWSRGLHELNRTLHIWGIYTSTPDYNDNPDTTEEDVVNLFETTIDRLEREHYREKREMSSFIPPTFVSEVNQVQAIQKAKEILDARGWYQGGSQGPDGSVCVSNALCMAVDELRGDMPFQSYRYELAAIHGQILDTPTVSEIIGINALWHFNDEKDTTREDIDLILDLAIEHLEESQERVPELVAA